jgi:hypothetical protein
MKYCEVNVLKYFFFVTDKHALLCVLVSDKPSLIFVGKAIPYLGGAPYPCLPPLWQALGLSCTYKTKLERFTSD